MPLCLFAVSRLKVTRRAREPSRSPGSKPSKPSGRTGAWASTSRAIASMSGRHVGSSRESAIDSALADPGHIDSGVTVRADSLEHTLDNSSQPTCESHGPDLRPLPYHLGAQGSIEVVDAGQRLTAVGWGLCRSAQLLHFAAAPLTLNPTTAVTIRGFTCRGGASLAGSLAPAHDGR